MHDIIRAYQHVDDIANLTVYRRITASIRLRRIAIAAEGDQAAFTRGTYLTLLSRPPTRTELAEAKAYWQNTAETPNQAATDLAWALINSMEFLYRH